MSAILDALRKLDREKSLRRGATPDISAEILKPGRLRSGRRLALYLVAVCFVTAAITWAVLVRFDVKTKPSLPTVIQTPEPARSIPPSVPSPPPSESKSFHSAPAQTPSSVSRPTAERKLLPPVSLRSSSPTQEISPSPSRPSTAPESLPSPAIVLPGPSPEAPSSPPPREAARDLTGEPKRMDPKTNPAVETRLSPASGAEKKADQPVFTEPVPAASGRVEKPQRAAPPESAGEPPVLRVSGIVWSEDSSQRVAVVNGLTVAEGDSIEGVRVVQIFPTRVRFLQNELPFEILLGSAAIVK